MLIKNFFWFILYNLNLYILIICTNSKIHHFKYSHNKQLKTVFLIFRYRSTFFMSTRYIIEARQFILLKIGSGHWRKSARIIQNQTLFFFVHQSQFFPDYFKWISSSLYYSFIMDFCNWLDKKYSQLTNLYIWPLFSWKGSVYNST